MEAPLWFASPPEGLTDAERRVLEAFFVAEEVKPAAKLLSLSWRTVQNELLLARQTMDESKSWMAAIRYVFYSKRHDHPFLEPGLVPKIDRQVRRLIDDYLEHHESDSSTIAEPSEQTTTSVSVEPPGTEIVPAESWIEMSMPEAQFESQLLALTRVAARVYEWPVRRRRRRTWAGAAACVLSLAAFASWAVWDQNRFYTVPELQAAFKSAQARLEANPKSQDVQHQCAILTDRLCSRYWEEMWGPQEFSVVEIFKTYPKEIDTGAMWAVEHDKAQALRIFGNGHRGFNRSRTMWEKWFPMLMEVVMANEGNKSVYMVRSLCGVVFGCLNNGREAGIDLSVVDKSQFEDYAVKGLRQLESITTDPYDRANAIRHIAMTKNVDEDGTVRIETCKKAKKIYESLGGGERAKRGIAQCLLSIAQSSARNELEQESRAVKAFPAVKATGNFYVEYECITNIAEVVGGALKEPRHTAIMSDVRSILWQHAAECGQTKQPERQASMLLHCLEIDVKDSPEDIPVDIQELLITYKDEGMDSDTSNRLRGYVYSKLRNRKDLLNSEQKGWATIETNRTALTKGGKLSDAEAVDLIKFKKPKQEGPQ